MNQRGFTLVELLIAMAVGVVAMGSIAATFQIQFKSLKREEMASEMRNNVRVAVELMTKELLMAGYDPSGNAGAGIVTATASSINFTRDRDGDGLLTGVGEDIEYEYDATDLTVTRNSHVIAENITGVSFTYYDSGNNSTSIAADVRRIRVQVNGRSRGRIPEAGYLTTSLSSDATPRNLAF
jgi:type IV pilus assembly protein PilW